MATWDCFAVTAPGLEGLAAAELKALGIPGRPGEGGVEFAGTWEEVMRSHLHLRTVGRILVRLGSFSAKAFSELEKKILRLPWKEFLVGGRPVSFRVTSRSSRLYHTGAITERLGLWLQREFGARTEDPANEDETSESQLFVVRILRDQVTVSADASGIPLHRRGYRQYTGKAPLRETLAAALLLAAGWRGQSSFLDPLCGSGTLVLEGALLARNIPPALATADRTPPAFRFLEWQLCPHPLWTQLIEQAKKEIQSSSSALWASDRDAGAIRGAQENAVRAGLDSDIDFRCQAFSAASVPEVPGLVLTNPPYGKRVGEGRDLRDLYAGLGNWLRRVAPDWRAGVFCPDRELATRLGFPLEKILATKNGGLPTSLWMGQPGGS